MERNVVLSTAWVGSALGAVGLGFVALSLLDGGPTPVVEQSASTGAAETGAAGTSSSAPATTTSAAPGATGATTLTGEQATAAGTVFGSCTAGQLTLGSAPMAGWQVDDSPDPGSVELRSGERKVEVHAVCGPTGPTFVVEDSTAGATASHSDDDARTTAPAPGPAPAVPTQHDVDDDNGSGGHGADDSGADDSGSGGHGSDDGPDDSGSDDSGSGHSGSGGHGSDD